MQGLPLTANTGEIPSDHSFRLFASIPPERMGLNGEYDHDGLAKRVQLALSQQFLATDLRALNTSQRGGVVVFYGWVSSQAMLEQIKAIAQSIHGATDVETIGVNLRQFEHAAENSPCGT